MVTNEKFIYPRQKIFGFFLIAIAVVMYLSIALKNNGQPNAIVFAWGYMLAMFGIMLNPIIRRKFSVGQATKKQSFMSNLSMGILFIGALIIYEILGKSSDYRLIWCLLFGLVGVHFITFISVHGKIIVILAALLIINAAIAIAISAIPLAVVFLIDGTIKLIIGLVYIRVSPVNW